MSSAGWLLASRTVLLRSMRTAARGRGLPAGLHIDRHTRHRLRPDGPGRATRELCRGSLAVLWQTRAEARGSGKGRARSRRVGQRRLPTPPAHRYRAASRAWLLPARSRPPPRGQDEAGRGHSQHVRAQALVRSHAEAPKAARPPATDACVPRIRRWQGGPRKAHSRTGPLCPRPSIRKLWPKHRGWRCCSGTAAALLSRSLLLRPAGQP